MNAVTKQTSTMRSRLISSALAIFASAALLAASDWPEYRGPARDGRSTETGLPEKWSPSGDNLAWRAPFGGRSGPIVVGNRVYLQNLVGDDKTTQERLMCLDADTRQADLGAAVQHLPQRRAAAPRGLGVPRRRPGDREHLRVHGGGGAHRRVARGKGALVAVARRGFRRDHDPRRPHGIADRRRPERDRQHAQLRLGRPGAHEQQVLRVRQDERDRRSGSARRSSDITTPTTRCR